MDSSTWHDVLAGRQPAVRLVAGCRAKCDVVPRWILPGSFNPRHRGHERMADYVRQQHGQTVEFELSVDNVEKPTLSDVEISQRLAAFGPTAPIWITRAPTFVAKSKIFPSATFLIGTDTLVRIADPRHYPHGMDGLGRALEQIRRADCRFLVFGRLLKDQFQTLHHCVVPPSLVALCQAVPEADFREDISSTQLRGPVGPVTEPGAGPSRQAE